MADYFEEARQADTTMASPEPTNTTTLATTSEDTLTEGPTLMAYPPGVSLATITIGAGRTMFGAAPKLISATVTPVFKGTPHVVHATSGWAFYPTPQTFRVVNGEELTFQLPHVDSEGWRDTAGNEFPALLESGERDKGWAYHAKFTVIGGAGQDAIPHRYEKVFQPLVGQTGPIDIDLVPDGQIGEPVSAPAPLVQSVNGLTGAVIIEAGADDGQIAELLQDTTSAVGAALESTINVFGRVPALAYDEFTGASDGPLAGRTPLHGPVWRTTGNTPVYIENGEATSSGTGYAYMTTAEKPEAVWADVRFSVGTSADDKPFAIAFCATDDSTMLSDFAAHAVIGPKGFTLEVRKDGEEPFPRLLTGQWFRQMAPGEFARVGVVVRGSTVTLFGPYGEVYTATDPRVAENHGNTVFWEPRAVNGSQAYIRNVTASTRTSTGMANGAATLADLAMMGSRVDGSGKILGNPGSFSQVGIGSEPTSKQPAVVFGADIIRLTLQADVLVGATSVLTDGVIPAGSALTFDSGNSKETATSGAYSTGARDPYTTTVTTALTKAHAKGTVVTAVPPATLRKSMYLHQGNGYFFMPDASVTVFPAGALWIGSQLDTRIMRHTAGVAGTHQSQGFRTGTFTTAGRPSASSFGTGTQIFDTTLSKPLWSNGTAWVDATGTAV